MVMKSPFSLALITGASSGIGEALCRSLAAMGTDLLITGRNADKLKLLEGELGLKVKVTALAADLSIAEERKKVVELLHEKVPDLVINNAGFGLYGDALSHSTAEQLEILNLNGNVVLELSLEGARAMVTHGKPGVIMNISSAAAFQVFPAFAVYASSKSFVNQFSQAFDYEMRSFGIRVLTACPGMVATDFTKRASASDQNLKLPMAMTSEEAAAHIWKQILSGKQVNIFDWRTRLLTILSRFVPARLIAKIVRNDINQRLYNK